NIGGRTVTQLTNDPSRDVMPTFSPDSERVAFASDRGGNFDIYIMSIDGGKVVQITSDAGHEMHPSWSPDGNLLAYCKLGETSGKWEIWVVDLRTYTRHFVEWGLFPQWCPDITVPKILIQRGQQRGKRYYSVWTVDFINGEALHPTQIVSSDAAAVMNPAWGPDGTRIVFTTVTETADDPEQADLWVVNLDGTGQTNLTNGLYANFVPTWSPDGTIYFVSNRSGIDNIWALQPDRALTLTRSDRPGVASGPASTTTGVATAPTD
ncbi:MAG: PD40 domain-containing protein, partial [Phycisphaerales bacterium]|nr:PD40 domain-containing protein [Phycisphaerales bacterium]